MFEAFLEEFSRLISPESPFVYLLCFAGGILSSFLPCSLSSLPLIIGYVKAGKTDTGRAFGLSLVFALGMSVMFTLLATVALALGRMISSATSWWYYVLGALMLLMGLQMMGIINIIPSTYLQGKNTRRGYLGALISGLLSGVFSSPCSTPTLVAILSIASVSKSLAFSIALILSYALGYSILSILAGTFVGFAGRLSASRGYEKASRVIEIVLGVLIMLLGFYLFYIAF